MKTISDNDRFVIGIIKQAGEVVKVEYKGFSQTYDSEYVTNEKKVGGFIKYIAEQEGLDPSTISLTTMSGRTLKDSDKIVSNMIAIRKGSRSPPKNWRVTVTCEGKKYIYNINPESKASSIN